MKNLNSKALGWAGLLASSIAILYLISASLKANTDWSLTVLAAVVASATVLGTMYAILKDVVGTGDVPIVSLEEYGWPLGRVVALSTVLLVVAAILGGLVGVIMLVDLLDFSPKYETSAVPLDDAVAIAVAGVVGSVFLMAGSYFVGRGMGYQSRERAVVGIVAAVVMAKAILFLLAMSMLGYEQFAERASKFGVEIWHYLADLGILIVIGAIGVWRGKRTRASHYLHYVLQRMPRNSRAVLLELAHSEATRIKRDHDEPGPTLTHTQ